MNSNGGRSNPVRRKPSKKSRRQRKLVNRHSKFSVESPLVLTQFAAGASGFTAQFNHPVDSSVLNLYDTQAGTFDPADVTVTGASAGTVKGTLTVENDNLRFIKTGGVLAADIYTVTMRSSANGVKSTDGDLLDGDANGVVGDNYVHAGQRQAELPHRLPGT